jgi:hypothetical protein
VMRNDGSWIRSKRCMLVSLALLCCASFIGCNGQSAMERRMAEFAYTPESLVSELIPRLEAAAAGRKRRQSESSKAASVREQEADRGNDSDRPDPNSIPAIVSDVAVKLKALADGDIESALSDVIQRIEASDKLDKETKDEFVAALKLAVQASEPAAG